MITEANRTNESRIRNNPHFAAVLRKRLLSRHGEGALRQMLARLTDEELIDAYLRNEKQGREHMAKRRTEKAGCE